MRSSFYVLILTALFYPLVGVSATPENPAKAPTLKPTIEELRQTLAMNYNFSPFIPFDLLRQHVGKISYQPIQYMRAGQVSFAYLTVGHKIERAPKEFDVVWSEKNLSWKLNYDNGRALLSEDKSLMGVIGPDGIYLVDGNHKSLTSLYFGAKTAPIFLKEDLSIKADGTAMTIEEFRSIMKERGHVFLTKIDGSVSEWPPLLDQMENDPNRHFISLITTKLKIKIKEDGKVKIKNRRGSDDPILVKIGRDVEFFELELSRRLHAAGLHYEDRFGDRPPHNFIAIAARLLWDMRQAGDPFLKKILMFSEPHPLTNEQLEVLLEKFFKENPIACESYLTNPDSYF